MNLEESIQLSHVVRSCIKVVGCNFPKSLVGINVDRTCLENPPVFIYVRLLITYKSIYIPYIVYKSRIVIKNKGIIEAT